MPAVKRIERRNFIFRAEFCFLIFRAADLRFRAPPGFIFK
jgi:hypothetical protein